MRVLAQPEDSFDVPCRLESRRSGLAMRNPLVFMVCCNQSARNGEPNVPSLAGVLLDGESSRVNIYAPRTTAVLLAIHEKDSGR